MDACPSAVQLYTAGGHLRCRFTEDGRPCPEPALYVAVVDDCVLCPRYGFTACPGHRACIEHGALLRGGCLEWDFPEGDAGHGRGVSVERISAVFREAS